MDWPTPQWAFRDAVTRILRTAAITAGLSIVGLLIVIGIGHCIEYALTLSVAP